MKITEQNFITQIIQGNEKALEYCMYHYGGLVRAVVRRHLGSLSKFEDECINDVFFAVWSMRILTGRTRILFPTGLKAWRVLRRWTVSGDMQDIFWSLDGMTPGRNLPAGGRQTIRHRSLRFWKMNGAGNDFIIINNMVEHLPETCFPTLARTLCERHLSIGADGLMIVDAPLQGGDYRMLFFNSDGSLGEMCGNGARCICRYGYENGLAGEIQRVETTAGLVTGHRIDQRLYRIRLNDPTTVRLDAPVVIDGVRYECSYLELGDPGLPHAVVPYPNLAQADENALRELGRKIRFYPEFPKGANVNFCELTGEDEVFERTFERGVEDFTYACGTGTGCVVTALTLMGKVSGRQVRVNMTGGQLIVDVDLQGSTVQNLYLTGPTNIVCKGEVTDEELSLN